MSVVYQWPVAAIRHWIMPLSYVVGVTYDGRAVNPVHQHFDTDLSRGVITMAAWFSEPVIEVRGFSRVRDAYTYPLVVIPDYPVFGVFLDIRIKP